MDNQEKLIKDAQYRKGLSIAFFNATNSAIEMVKMHETKSVEEMQERYVFWRDYFIEQHKNYYATVIAGIGQNFKIEDSLDRLKKAKNYDELSNIWLSLSEDERRTDAILKVAKELGIKYKNEKA